MLFFRIKLSHQAIFKHKAPQVFIPQLFLSHLWTTFLDHDVEFATTVEFSLPSFDSIIRWT